MVTDADSPEPEAVDRAVALAWRAVSARERTEAELRAFLERRQAGEEAIDAAVVELRSAGYLDDAAYARRFAEDRRALRRWGSGRIARDLARRGVAPELVAAAVGEPEGGERRRARVLLSERHPELPGDDRARARAWRTLVRHGYAPELAYEVVRAREREGAPGAHGDPNGSDREALVEAAAGASAPGGAWHRRGCAPRCLVLTFDAGGRNGSARETTS